MLLAYLVDALGAPLSVSVFANGNIKYFQIVVAMLSVLGLIAGFLCLKAGALPYVISIIIFFVHSGFFIADLYFARKYCKVSLRGFIRKTVLPTILVTMVSTAIPIALSFVNVGKWEVLMVVAADLIWVAIIVLLLGLEKEERNYLMKSVMSKFKIK